MQYRGSRMHVLDWVGSGEHFTTSMNAVLDGTGFHVEEGCLVLPKSHKEPGEARLGKACGGLLTQEQNRALLDWWLVRQSGANVPNWDLACRATSADGRPGLVLIEAKANVPEFSHGGGGKARGNAENHAQITRAVEEARVSLQGLGWPVRISHDHWYQLSNRVAFAWKLASMGIPTVLIYLGFLADEGIRDAGEPLRSDDHWRNLVAQSQDVVPPGMWGTEILVGGTPLYLLIRSRPCLRQSPAAVSRSARQNLALRIAVA